MTLSLLQAKFYKIVFKLLVVPLWLVSKWRYRQTRDPTLILLDQFTEPQLRYQKQWSQGLEGDPQTSSHTSAGDNAERLLVVIPFRDQWDLTLRCLNSVIKQKLEKLRVTVVLANNQSVRTETHKGIAEMRTQSRDDGFKVEVFDANYPFNFSKINNDVVKAWLPWEPSYLLFLNNDIEILGDSFILEMIDLAKKAPKLGVLGCSLSYPDNRIQHLFLAPGVKIVGAHPLKGVPLNRAHRWFQQPRPVAAVTGAVMIMKASVFQEINGFDELLPSLGQDLDLCLKAQRSGRVNWVASHLVCIHAEGLSRGKRLDKAQVKYIYEKWGARLTANEYFSRKLSRWSEYPVLSFGEADYPWEKVL